MNEIVTWLNSWTMGGKLSILVFLPFAFLLFFASLRLVKFAEVIIHKTKFGGAFIGGALIAAVTSIPELITEVAQSSVGFPGAGTADDLGSNAFSGFLIAIACIIFYKTRFFEKLDKFSKITILISSLLAFALCGFMIFNKDVDLGLIGIIPLILFLIYLFMLFIQYKFDHSNEDSFLDGKFKTISVKKSIFSFMMYAMIITALALIVNLTASSIIEGAGLPQDGVGGILLAITTSLPEVVAFFMFLKRKQPMTAVAALIGSHFFNIGIAFFGDLAYSDGPTFNVKSVGDNWPIALFTGIMMLILFIYSCFAKKIKNKVLNIAIPSLAASSYVIGWILVLVL